VDCSENGILQNNKVNPKLKDVKSAFNDAEDILVGNNYDAEEYSNARDEYNKQKNKLNDIENTRNLFYIAAGTFGVIGIVSFVF